MYDGLTRSTDNRKWDISSFGLNCELRENIFIDLWKKFESNLISYSRWDFSFRDVLYLEIILSQNIFTLIF
jgi:hypothetical protein